MALTSLRVFKLFNFEIEIFRRKMWKTSKINARIYHCCRYFSIGTKILSKKETFMKLRYKKWGNDFALEHFDEFYKPVYGSLWPSIRLALLSTHKYCCFLNNFGDTEQSMELMDKLDALDVRRHFNRRLKFLREKIDENGNDRVTDTNALSPENLEEELEQELMHDEDEVLTTPDSAVGRFAAHDADRSSYLKQFVPATKLRGMENWIDESDYFQSYVNSLDNLTVGQVKSQPRALPPNWKIYCYSREDISTFPQPNTGLTGVLNYYLMDATSVLPVFALDPTPGDSILDMCAAPGGKSLAILQTLYPVKLVCVDDQLDRAKRLRRVLESYLPDGGLIDYPTIKVGDGRHFHEQTGQFNKILVDAPCTTDRRSVNELENNIFKPTRMKERVNIPTVQTELLSAALNAVTVGGTVVYSTCSLSPVQNDNVVKLSIKNLSQKSSAKFVIHDLSNLFFPLRFLMRFHPSPKYGQLVIPYLPCNFGPMYVSKIVKLSE